MSELIIPVKSKSGEPVTLVPSRLIVEPTVDFDTQTVSVKFNLQDDNKTDNSIYSYRQIAVHGELQAKLPLAVFTAMKNADGSYNPDVINEVLKGFDLEFKEEKV